MINLIQCGNFLRFAQPARLMYRHISPSQSHLRPPSIGIHHLLLRRLFSVDASDRYSRLLHAHTTSTTPKPNLERALSQTLPSKPLHSSTVASVLTRPTSPPHLRTLLRFFVWAGLQKPYRHSTALYVKACERLELRKNPGLIGGILDEYRHDGTAVSARTFRIMLELCRRADLTEDAVLILRRMGDFNCRPDTSVYNSVLRLLVGRGVDEMLGFFEEMAVCGLRPDMVTYVLMVKNLCDANQFEKARVLVGKMQQADGCVPNVVIYSALIDGACKCGDSGAAVEVLGELESVGKPNVVSYTCLIKYLCRQRKLEHAVEMLDRMVRNGCIPNRVTVATILRGFVEDGRVDEAYGLAGRLVTEMNVSSTDCYNSLVVCLLERKEMSEAEKLVENMLAMGVRPDGAVCSCLVRGLCDMDRCLDGFNWVAAMWRREFSFDSDAYSVLVKGLCRSGALVEAGLLVKGMLERHVPVESSFVDSLVELLNQNGESDLAIQISRSGWNFSGPNSITY